MKVVGSISLITPNVTWSEKKSEKFLLEKSIHIQLLSVQNYRYTELCSNILSILTYTCTSKPYQPKMYCDNMNVLKK